MNKYSFAAKDAKDAKDAKENHMNTESPRT
jgi:hypothetical protein